jgi:hypothetical protein
MRSMWTPLGHRNWLGMEILLTIVHGRRSGPTGRISEAGLGEREGKSDALKIANYPATKLHARWMCA